MVVLVTKRDKVYRGPTYLPMNDFILVNEDNSHFPGAKLIIYTESIAGVETSQSRLKRKEVSVSKCNVSMLQAVSILSSELPESGKVPLISAILQTLT